MTLGQLKHQLRNGKQPTELGEYLGGGSSREAYLVGPFVIKESQHIAGKSWYDPSWLQSHGVRFAPTVRVGPWDIQLYYPSPIEHYPEALRDMGDLHPHNLAQDKRGRLVAFDW